MTSSEPSLHCLFNFINNYEKLNDDEKALFKTHDFSVIADYWYDKPTAECKRLCDLIKSFGKGIVPEKATDDDLDLENVHSDFYLGGHIKISKEAPITDELIKLTEKKINSIDYSQCHGREMYSVQEHNIRFANFKKLYYSYKELYSKNC